MCGQAWLIFCCDYHHLFFGSKLIKIKVWHQRYNDKGNKNKQYIQKITQIVSQLV